MRRERFAKCDLGLLLTLLSGIHDLIEGNDTNIQGWGQRAKPLTLINVLIYVLGSLLDE